MAKESKSRYATFDEVAGEMQRLIKHQHRLACATCMFFEHADEMTLEEFDITEPPFKMLSMQGLCRRNAPRPVLDLDDDGRAAWPIVDYKSDWCGEHRMASNDRNELANKYTQRVKESK